MLALTSAAGVTVVAAANVGANSGSWWSELAFWMGLLLIAVPVGLRLMVNGRHRFERVSLILIAGLALYLCKVVHDPLRVTNYDEFLHWITAQDIIATGRLFTPNTLLSVSPYYPGLELATAALTQLGGISVYDAGVLVLAAARIVFVLGLYLLFELVTRSSRTASIATFIYMLNPKFLYFDSQFSYETLALPLAALAIYAVARRGYAKQARWSALTALALMAMLATVATHHVTSGMLALFLTVWTACAFLVGARGLHKAKPGRFTMATYAAIVGWTLLVATATIGYLAPAITDTVFELLSLASGDLDARELFVSRGGDVSPFWERAVGTASVAVILLGLPFGLLAIWRRFRHSPLAITLALVACVYPLSLLARFTLVGAEVATRLPEFLFVGISFVLAVALARLRWHHSLVRTPALVAGISLILVGGVVVGIPRFARLPGPYLVSADARSVEAEGIGAAQWSGRALGPGNRFVADRVNRVLLATYGRQELVISYVERVPIAFLFLAAEIGPREREIARAARVRYLLIDRRLATDLPVVGHYFDRGEERDLGVRTVPISPTVLAKFDALPGVSRLFDGGNIQVYDIGAIVAD